MKKHLRTFAAVCAAVTLLASCKKDAKDAVANEISQETLSQIQRLGFSTEGAQKTPGGYLVEGDILLSDADLTSSPSSPNMLVASEEQYRTFNMVNVGKHPTIQVALNNSSSQHQAAFSAALDTAINRYNAEKLTFLLERVAPGTTGVDITVEAYYQVSNVLGFAGFPTSAGEPFNQVQMNTYHYSTSTGVTNLKYIGTIIAHELGHCVGFRHTDYMNRALSCGGRKQNEGQATNGVGAVHIPGTPTKGDPNSWMLACVGSNVNRPFNANDKIALAHVY
jgi:hypothetical protein